MKGISPKAEMHYLLQHLFGPKAEVEYNFDIERRFKFDFALPIYKIGIEYEGLNFKVQKSRHQTIKGFSTDCEKYNLATVNGWKVLRYTAINYRNMQIDLEKLLNAQFENDRFLLKI